MLQVGQALFQLITLPARCIKTVSQKPHHDDAQRARRDQESERQEEIGPTPPGRLTIRRPHHDTDRWMFAQKPHDIWRVGIRDGVVLALVGDRGHLERLIVRVDDNGSHFAPLQLAGEAASGRSGVRVRGAGWRCAPVHRELDDHGDNEYAFRICNGLGSTAGYGTDEDEPLCTAGTSAARVDRILSVDDLVAAPAWLRQAQPSDPTSLLHHPGPRGCQIHLSFVAGLRGQQRGMANEPISAPPAAQRVRRDMLDEGRRLVDAARSEGITLRLLGGLGVREHCRTLELCERDYSDLDMVALGRQARHLAALFAGFGYAENYEVSTATANGTLQFVRPCEHDGGLGLGRAHTDDHIDVFLDTFRMDHDIALAKRLQIEPYTVSLGDLLLTKLQIFKLNEKDLRDIVTLLGDFDVGEEDGPQVIDGSYVGELCAGDWGLFYDVAMNLKRVEEGAATFGLSEAQVARVRHGVMRLIAAIDGAPKSARWRLRARVGTRKNWHSELDGQE